MRVKGHITGRVPLAVAGPGGSSTHGGKVEAARIDLNFDIEIEHPPWPWTWMPTVPLIASTPMSIGQADGSET